MILTRRVGPVGGPHDRVLVYQQRFAVLDAGEVAAAAVPTRYEQKYQLPGECWVPPTAIFAQSEWDA